jgi:hypothetical protein
MMSVYAYGAIVAQALLWILWRLKYGNLTIGSAFVIAIINAQYLLVEFDIGGYSLRVYAAIAGMLSFLRFRGWVLIFQRLGNAGLLRYSGSVFLESHLAVRSGRAVRCGFRHGRRGISQWASNWLVPLLCISAW